MTMFLTTRDVTSGLLRRSGKLSLVDLAGSERLKRSEAVGDRRKEAQYINKSLSALADVISAKERRVTHVPYRNSKLTQLLQDALGGQEQCRTVVIVALPPNRDSLPDSMHSLQFSQRLTALSLPTVVSKSAASKRSLDSQSRARPPAAAEVRDQLLHEVDKWRTEKEKVQAQLEEYKQKLEQKERLLVEERRRNAELLATQETLERNRVQLFQGFCVLNRRLQDADTGTPRLTGMNEKGDGSPSSEVSPRRIGSPPSQKRAITGVTSRCSWSPEATPREKNPKVEEVPAVKSTAALSPRKSDEVPPGSGSPRRQAHSPRRDERREAAASPAAAPRLVRLTSGTEQERLQVSSTRRSDEAARRTNSPLRLGRLRSGPAVAPWATSPPSRLRRSMEHQHHHRQHLRKLRQPSGLHGVCH